MMELEFARNWRAVALRGVLAILFGVLAFFWPGLLWLMVVYLFAFYALLDVALALVPLAGLVVVAWWIGAYAVAFGVLLLALAFQLRSWSRDRTLGIRTAPPAGSTAFGQF